MVMMADPLFKAIDYALNLIDIDDNVRIVYPSPQGRTWNQRCAEKLSKYEKIIMICGHYKGIDERVIEKYVTDEYSLGDFIMTSGEIPAMAMLDSVMRLIPGTLNTLESALTDSFTQELLDYPHYSKPRKINEMSVPEVLIGGHHEKIASWRQNQKELKTKQNNASVTSFAKAVENDERRADAKELLILFRKVTSNRPKNVGRLDY